MDGHRGAGALVHRDLIRIHKGCWRGRDLIYGGQRIGYAERGVLHEPEGELIADVRKIRSEAGYQVWAVEDAHGARIGTLVPATRLNWRGKRKAVNDVGAMDWTGTLRIGGSNRDVAVVRGGAVISQPDATTVAEVRITDKPEHMTQTMWGTWTLKFHRCDDPQLRLMCFGWLALAWRLQRARDNLEQWDD